MGPVVDVEFEKQLPALKNALLVKQEAGRSGSEEPSGSKRDVVLEVAQHLGGNRVRTVAMNSTEGLRRKTEVVDSGSPISLPVGEKVLGIQEIFHSRESS